MTSGWKYKTSYFILHFNPINFPHKTTLCSMKNQENNDGIREQTRWTVEKHGIKSIGSWFVPMEHLLIVIDEAPSLDASQKFLMEPEWMALLAY